MLFLHSCVLVLLHRAPGYGYSLVDGLEGFGFPSGAMDISILYRVLREMEAAGLVVGSWDDEKSLGPQRRIYSLTPQGESTLAEWMQALSMRRKEIEALEAAYDAVKKRSHK